MREKSNFSTKTFVKLNRFYKNFVIFSTYSFTNFNFYGALCKGREISVEFSYLAENFIKNAKNRLDRGRILVKE